jgi:shikimate kinase
MILYFVGISCVGKSTIGGLLSNVLKMPFFDLDIEIEKYYQKPIETIQNECFSMDGFREKGSFVLDLILSQNKNAIIASTPSGLMFSYLQVYKKHRKTRDIVSIHIFDSPENILKRLVFFDEESQPMTIELTDLEKKRYLKKIISDYNYFKNSYLRADLQFNISNLSLEDISPALIDTLSLQNKSTSPQPPPQS